MENHSGKGTALRIQMIATAIAASVLFPILIIYVVSSIPSIKDNTISIASVYTFETLLFIWIGCVFYNLIVSVLYVKKYKEKALAITGIILSSIVASIVLGLFVLSLAL